jgi:anthranilate phosphoribosyltransferase
MTGLSGTLEQLLRGEDLSEQQAAELLVELTREDLPPALAAALLAALRAKGETAAEVRGFATAMRGLARKPELADPRPAAGYRGHRRRRLRQPEPVHRRLPAGCGLRHSRRQAWQSQYLVAQRQRGPPGGARHAPARRRGCRERLPRGDRLHLPVRAAFPSGNEGGGAGPPRHGRAHRVQPARAAHQSGGAALPAAGAFSPDAARLMAGALAGMAGLERGFVVHGAPGWDEATPVGPFLLLDVRRGEVVETTRDPAEWDLPRCMPEDLAGGDAAHNAARLRAVFTGRETGPHLDALLLGTALALELTGLAGSPREAVGTARRALLDGRAAALLEALAHVGAEPAA